MSDTPLNDALKPCPCCGCVVILTSSDGEIYCDDCDLQANNASAWNTRANTPDSAAQGAMDRNQLVDEALAKIATLGTIGAMKWLGAQYSNSSKPTDATAQPITDERAAFENAIAICDDYYDKQLPMMKAGNQSEDYLSGYNNACGDLGHVFRALKSAPAAITGKDAK